MATASTTRRQTSRKQAGTTTSKKPAPLRAAPTDTPVGRFAELLTEIEQPEPYEVTAEVSILPPSKGQMELVIAAQSAYVIAQGQLEALMTPLTDEDGQVIKDERGQPVLPEVDERALDQIKALCAKAAEDYDRALFGDAYDEIMRLSQRWTGAVWNAFYKDVQDKFLPVPEDGRCPTCGSVVDADAAGKADESSTSLTATGTT